MTPAAPPRLYSLAKMPRVDAHTHLRDIEGVAAYARQMKACGISVAVSLGLAPHGRDEMLSFVREVHRRWRGRILVAPGKAYERHGTRIREGLPWTMKDLERFREAGCAGVKIYAQYNLGLSRPSIMKKIARQGELGLPMLGLHIADPPEGGWWRPNYWPAIREAEQVVARNPKVTFIMAHGFWLTNTDEGLDVLDGFFRKYANLNADLAACFQWWDPPQPDTGKLREFLIRHKARLLYGTDANPRNLRRRQRYAETFRLLETRTYHARGYFGQRSETFMRALDLPVEVLNHIYWWNAARLIPRVADSLRRLGYLPDRTTSA